MRFLSAEARAALSEEEIESFEIMRVFLDPPYTTASIRLCATDEPQNVAGAIYQPFRWSRDDVSRTSDDSGDRTSIFFADPTGGLARIHRRFDFSRAEVSVLEVHRSLQSNAQDLIPIFRGKAASPNFDESGFRISVVSRLSVAGRTLAPQRDHGVLCPLLFGGEDCGVDKTKSSNNYDGVATAGSSDIKIVDGGLTQPEGFWDHATVKVVDGNNFGLPPFDVASYKPAVGATPGEIEVFWPYPETLAGAVYRLTRGCGRTIRWCRDEHANLTQNGSFPNTPRPVVLGGQSVGGFSTR